MATEVILNLPDNMYHQAARLARLMNQDVSRVLAETIASALSPLGSSAVVLAAVEELSDSEVLAAAELRMDEAQGKRLGKLLDRQQAGKLSEAERSELAALIQIYHENLVRKAQALGEAVRRGLREPPASVSKKPFEKSVLSTEGAQFNSPAHRAGSRITKST